jgi:hypothetical protein
MSGLWFACDEPERPTDPWVQWHYGLCTGCRVKSEALALQHPDDEHVNWVRWMHHDEVTS